MPERIALNAKRDTPRRAALHIYIYIVYMYTCIARALPISRCIPELLLRQKVNFYFMPEVTRSSLLSFLLSDRLRSVRSTGVSLSPFEPNSSRNWLEREETPERHRTLVYILPRRIFFSAWFRSFLRIEFTRDSSPANPPFYPCARAIYEDLARSRAHHLRDYDNCDREIERLYGSFASLLPQCGPYGAAPRLVHVYTFLSSIPPALGPRVPLFRYFSTISRSGATNRKGHSWPACKSAAPCKSACNSGRGRERGRPCNRGGGGRKRKKNYDRHGSRITLGNRPRWTPEVAVVDIGNYFDLRLRSDSPGSRSELEKGYDKDPDSL